MPSPKHLDPSLLSPACTSPSASPSPFPLSSALTPSTPPQDPLLAPATLALHADDDLHTTTSSSDIAPPIHVSTNFNYPDDPEELIPAREVIASTLAPAPAPHVYSRHSSPNTTRLETILSALLHGPCITYASGLSALHAAYTYLHPRRVSIGQAYFGSHGVLQLLRQTTGAQILPLDCPATDLHPGDVIHLETPINPSGLALDIGAYARKAHSRGAYLLVDATFGPPGLQDPFVHGADLVMHSGTKYLGGHGDLLCGVLACRPVDDYDGNPSSCSLQDKDKDEREVKEGGRERERRKGTDMITSLKAQRVHLGSVMGALEAWLLTRSLRTMTLRVRRQSDTAGSLVHWLHESLSPPPSNPSNSIIPQIIHSIHHASLQPEAQDPSSWLRAQMPRGYGPVFAIYMRTQDLARRLPSCLTLWRHATSLGGVESLVDWRALYDPEADGRLLRMSVGVEEEGDLRRDLERGFERVFEQEREREGRSKL